MEARTPSIRDVAQAAGVSQQTVSRVLNNHPSVRPSTRADVQQAIERLGYRRNAAARALASKHTNILGATVTNPQMFGPSGALLAIDRAARQAGFWLSVAFIRNQTAADMDDTLHHFLDLGAEGVVVIAPNPATLDAASAMAGKIPMVLATSGQSTLPAVDNDQAAGARAAVEHLIGLGHRRIGHIAGADDEFHATIRQQAWLDALAQAGLEPGPCLRGDWLPASGYAAGRQLLADGDLPTAVFVAND
ncbi:MAG: LacI family DNA-binding transcriptional regulator, partial [Propionibacteriaceae bacterium]|nr:LacI family DNA-binding transcriptional regulator [Propionibacteriaceae bacterium]